MTNAPASHPQTFRMHRFRRTKSGALERLPGFLSPTAARRRALTVILEDEHHREPEDLDVSARCAEDIQTSGHLAAPQAVPKRRPRPDGPRKEGTQPEAGCLSSQAVAFIRLIAACDSFRGRKPSATEGSPQPSSRRIAVWPLLALAYSLQVKQLKGVRVAHVRPLPPCVFRP